MEELREPLKNWVGCERDLIIDGKVISPKEALAMIERMQATLDKLADVRIKVVTDPQEGRHYYLNLALEMRDIARKATGKDYDYKLDERTGFLCGPKGKE